MTLAQQINDLTHHVQRGNPEKPTLGVESKDMLAAQLHALMSHVECTAKRHRVTLNDVSHDAREQAKEHTYKALKASGVISANALAKKMNRSYETVLKYLRDLKAAGRVRIVGTGRTMKWEAIP